MGRLLLVIPIYIGLTVVSIIDIVAIESRRVRAIPKGAWIVLVIVLPFIGSLLWFLIGRERRSAGRARAARSGPMAPDDDPAFLRKLNLDKEQEQRIRDLEERLAELDDDDPKP